jgi:hypothetical protein
MRPNGLRTKHSHKRLDRSKDSIDINRKLKAAIEIAKAAIKKKSCKMSDQKYSTAAMEYQTIWLVDHCTIR